MSKVQLTGAFARFRGKLNRSEVLVLKGCPCGQEQMAMDLLNPTKATRPPPSPLRRWRVMMRRRNSKKPLPVPLHERGRKLQTSPQPSPQERGEN